MKRKSITAIVDKCMQLTIRICFEPGNHKQIITRIKKAAVNEILRLQAEETPSYDPIAGIDFKTGVGGLFDAVKKITDDYNAKILNK
jgi:hypothetical protein